MAAIGDGGRPMGAGWPGLGPTVNGITGGATCTSWPGIGVAPTKGAANCVGNGLEGVSWRDTRLAKGVGGRLEGVNWPDIGPAAARKVANGVPVRAEGVMGMRPAASSVRGLGWPEMLFGDCTLVASIADLVKTTSRRLLGGDGWLCTGVVSTRHSTAEASLGTRGVDSRLPVPRCPSAGGLGLCSSEESSPTTSR